ncbi:MAG: DUF488 domain-containing protein, partial [Chloroflexi bacterium]|nr:DUF488 domain-containing protein [Chloroflexota bacterium]
ASAFVELLHRHQIQVVVDVRSSPYSQYSPQYNRELLAKTLQQAGIEYQFAGEVLGGRPKDPSCYKNQEIPSGKADFLHLVDYPTVMTKAWYQEGLKRLIAASKINRTAILCSEEDPARCHRHHLIGKSLLERGVSVLHIRGDGNLVRDQLLPNLHAGIPAQQLSLF